MKLRSEKNLDGDEGRDAEAGAANVTPTGPFEEEEQTLIRTDHHRPEDLEEPGEDFEREEIEKAQKTSERNYCLRGRTNRRQRTIVGEKNNPL